jgi:ABC-2 type transport system ATP-binding protein
MVKPQWFVRRRIGVGVRPITWQGWATSGGAVALIVVALVVLHGHAVANVLVVAIAVAYLGVAYATGGAHRPATQSDLDERLPETFAEQSGRFGSRDGEPAAPRLTVTDIHERLAPAASTGDTLATPTGPLAIDVRHLTKKFGERTAFNDVSFDVRQGEVFGFLGPNGAGKTTMVRTLSTLIQATSGSASVAGIAVCEENGVEIRQRISVMPEVPGLYSRLSVNDNLEFFVGLYALGDAKGRIARALHAVNLSTRSNDLCASLSKGLRQRVSIARALLSDPEIIFLDEPTSGLDPVATREVSELIEGLRSRGVTIFLTTHRLEEAEHLCDRVAILNTTLRIVGRTSDLRQQLFQRSLLVATLRPLDHPEMVFASIVGVDSWKTTAEASYELMTPDPRAAAPEIVRALVHAGADVVSIAESQHSLEDVYLQLVGEDAEVAS